MGVVPICCTCGCGIATHPHLDLDPEGGNITIQDLRRAANTKAAGGISVRQVINNILDTLDLADTATEAFLNGYALYGDELSSRAQRALENALEVPQQYIATFDGGVKAVDIKAAGILVRAKDTGRVMLIQRALTPGDPVSGLFELPGGRLDGDETPWDAATREFHEEIGVPLPEGQLTDSWIADTGVYQGFIWTIDAESDIDLHPDGTDRAFNPDDPEGDNIEVAIFVDPAHILSLPLRPEFRAYTPWRQILDIPAENEPRNLFELIEADGAKNGLLDRLYMRRDRVWMRFDQRSRQWARKLSHVVPMDRLALSIQQAFGHVATGPSITEDLSQQAQDQRKAVLAAALAMLRHTLQEFRALESEGEQLAHLALSEASAEGTAAAVATLAQQLGKELPNLDELKAQQLSQIQNLGTYWSQANEILKEQINGLAGDVALSATSMIRSGADLTDIQDAVGRLLANGDGAAFYLDQAIHRSWATAFQQFMINQGVASLAWITAGDARVCATCLALEANGPYPADVAPTPPDHASCRCLLAPA